MWHSGMRAMLVLATIIFMVAPAIFMVAPAIFMVAPARAHEVRPATLQLSETKAGQFQVLWKQPVTQQSRLKIAPIFPPSCTDIAPDSPHQLHLKQQSVVEIWDIKCVFKPPSTPPAPEKNKAQNQIHFSGLRATLTDIYVSINYFDGTRQDGLVRGDEPFFNIGTTATNTQQFSASYLQLGFDHILSGYDHLLLVLAFAIWVPRRQLIWVITSFTIAHSLTLAVGALNIVSIPARPVEILIALSLVFMAAEIIDKKTPPRMAWLLSFAIGLLHGLGFGTALRATGLPETGQAIALLLFNIGIELGQIMFLAIFVAGFWVLYRYRPQWHARALNFSALAIGGIGLFWTLDRFLVYF